jgi:dGTPase
MGYGSADAARYVVEPAKPTQRGAFARDRARVLHCSALRRLAAKTQVVVVGESDIPRTRLTHTLEVAQVAREIGAALGADPDLVEVAALAHDIGHPPFGHNGEDALHRVAADCGGFEGNAQSFRVLTRLEAKVHRGGRSVGLNLTRAALDAATKYPWPARPDTRKFGVYADDRPIFDWMREGAPAGHRCLEAQIMDWADDVAYSVHDVEDAVLMHHVDLGALGSREVRQDVAAAAHRRYAPDIAPAELLAAFERLIALPVWPAGFDGSHDDLAALKELTSALIGRFSGAAQEATQQHDGPGPFARYSADLRVPDQARAEVAVMKAVTAHFVMYRPEAARTYRRQHEVIAALADALLDRDGKDLDRWLHGFWEAAASDAERTRVVVDQIASLTDVSVVRWHERLCR